MLTDFDVLSSTQSVGPQVLTEPHTTEFDGTPEFSVQVLNTTGRDVCVVMRNGIKYQLEHRGHLNLSGGVRFIYKIKIPGRYFQSIKRQVLDNELVPDSSDNKALFDCFNEHKFVQSTMNIYTAEIEYFLSAKDIASATMQSAYFTEMDLLISYQHLDEVGLHPFSADGIKQDLHRQYLDGISGIGSGFMITIIDNNGKLGDCWTLFKESLFRVPAQRNPVLRDGIYLSRYGLHVNGKDINTEDTYALEHYEKLPIPLFRSKQDALDSATKLKELEYASKEVKLNNDIRKEELSSEKLVRDNIQHQWDVERKMFQDEISRMKSIADHKHTVAEYELKHDLERRKHFYDERSSSRKDTTDIIKTGITLLTLGVGLVALFKK